jgi:hypothetical protein
MNRLPASGGGLLSAVAKVAKFKQILETGVQELSWIYPPWPLVMELLEGSDRGPKSARSSAVNWLRGEEGARSLTYWALGAGVAPDMSFMVTSTMSSSPSTDLAMILESPESASEVRAISASVLSGVSSPSSPASSLRTDQVLKEAIFSRILRRIASSLRA